MGVVGWGWIGAIIAGCSDHDDACCRRAVHRRAKDAGAVEGANGGWI
jgi:hypothetical protein